MERRAPLSRGEPDIADCILWNNTAGTDCGSIGACATCLIDVDPLVLDEGSLDFSRVESMQGEWGVYVRPRFIVREPDFRLSALSPAIDQGTGVGAPASDRDGNPRPCGEAVDIGAYEYGLCGVLFRRGDANADGTLDIADPITVRDYLFAGGPGLSCLKSADSNDDGTVDIADVIYLLAYLFAGGSPPYAPFTQCGLDQTEDGLSCEYHVPCL